MAQLEHIEAIEKRLWSAADTLRANSTYASNEYFIPVMGLIFLRHAYSRFLRVRDELLPTLPSRGGKTRALTKEDFSGKGAIFLKEAAQFDNLVSLPDSADRVAAVIKAMESIEADYDSLKGMLPKTEYQQLDNEVMGQLLRTLNPDELKKVSGDVFGRIYEYFLTQFADQKAHDGGEFFTPISIVSFIAHVLEPGSGSVLDPACGSGGMFVQSARTVMEHGDNPTEKLTFYGMEKNETTIRLARMNLAVHGLEGDIKGTVSYYDDPHNLLGKADYVMANPPFNVDEIDADKIKADPRLPFGLPGVNKKGKVSNGNYVWISYFYSYLNEKGRAGFVMSSQASSAGGGEAQVRRQLVESGAVEMMTAIRSGFFYTRTVPCELWFLNRAKPAAQKDKVLMLDARNVFRKVTRKINDFSPEQEKNLLAIVRLYRGEKDRYLEQVAEHLERSINSANGCVSAKESDGYMKDSAALREAVTPEKQDDAVKDLLKEIAETEADLNKEFAEFNTAIISEQKAWNSQKRENAALVKAVERTAPFAESSRTLVKQSDHLYRLLSRLLDANEKPAQSVRKQLKALDESRHSLTEELKLIRYFWRQAHWLTDRFPDGKLVDVPGLVKVVDIQEIEANDWSLTPGRYVGVAPEVEDEDFDFEETMRGIHSELADLNEEAVELAATIQRNFEELVG